jgi:GNAT superfamily N-acetyltransferase
MSKRPSDFDGAFQVRAYEPKDEPQVLEVLGAAFGGWPDGVSGVTPSEFFRWKHLAGPFGPSSVLVIEAEDEVIGLVAYMAWQFRAAGQTLHTLRGTDFAVHPSYHGRGAAYALAAAALAHFPRDLAFVWGNPGEQSVNVSVKSGWHDVGRWPRFVQPRGTLRAAVAPALGRASKAPAEAPVAARSAAELLGHDAGASLPPAEARDPEDRLATVKDLDFLRWRYGRFDQYRAVRDDATAGGGGIAIFRHRRHGPAWVLDICELLVEQDDHRGARRLIQQVRESAPANLLSCSFHSRRHAALCGFVPAGHGGVLVSYPIQRDLRPDSTRLASWALSRGDLELL